ncbi:MAG: sucrase ferredoxin [Actinomycetota bacterium]|nr:sucrase ferredoxin [Actinomycetota bacterium]
MLEQPGAWGIDALCDSRLPAPVARALHERAHALKIRVILIRRPDRRPNGVNVFLAHTGGTRTSPVLFHGVIDDPASLLDLDLAPLHAGEPVGLGEPFDGPLFLVCTNGRHDVCCAERGRPLFRALAGEFPDRTWECSHIGGDRFAGNVVCFPHGVYFGWVEPDEAPAIARAYERGRLDLTRYRGRSSWPVDVQTAEQALRAHLGLAGVEDLLPARPSRHPDGSVQVTFRDGDGAVHTARVGPGSADPVFLTCRAEERVAPRTFEVLSLDAGPRSDR